MKMLKKLGKTNMEATGVSVHSYLDILLDMSFKSSVLFGQRSKTNSVSAVHHVCFCLAAQTEVTVQKYLI